MKIRTKGIFFDRYEDAPFNGVLISSINCSRHCVNCFNQHLLNENILEYEINDLIDIIKNNLFCNGIILGGLEWTEQPDELRCLVSHALANNLEVILYSGLSEADFKEKFNDIYNKPIYIKFGEYDENQKIENYYSYGIKLSSKNQYIKGKNT